MAMKVNGSYGHFGTDYAEKLKEKGAAGRAETAKEAEKAAEGKNPGKLSEPQDEYISSEKSGKKPTGLYRVGQDENGNRKIFFDDPKAACAKAVHADEDRFREAEDEKRPKVSGDGQGKAAEKCTANTDKVDREIKKLKEKKRQLEQRLGSASAGEAPEWNARLTGSDTAKARASANQKENKIRELEKELAQVEIELSQKDNETYRRQNTSVSA